MSTWTHPSNPEQANPQLANPQPIGTPPDGDSQFSSGPSSSENQTGGGPGAWLPQLRIWVRDLVVSLALAGVVILFLYQPVKVEGTSMEPRLTDQERVFINKFIYRLGSVERGDVVVFWYPRDVSKSFVKRVVGVPGDRVEMRAGELLVNGKQLVEPYLAPGFRGEDSFSLVEVPAGEFFVLGDHRNSSNDSRNWGTVPQRFIYGKAELVYWPVGRWGLLD